MFRTLRTLALCTVAAALAGGAQAQTVIGGGKTAPTFPIVISQPGSYKLAANLLVPAGVDGIVVSASDVSIDLNGYAITGPVTCSGNSGPASVVCTSSSSRGITSVGDTYRLAVRGGSVGGFGLCLETRYVSRIEGVAVHDCGTGVIAMNGSLLSQVSIHRASDAGAIYGSTADVVQVHFARTGFSTAASMLRSVSMNAVYQSFMLSGSTNSALSLSVINATILGSGVQSVGGNLCNGVAC